MGIYGAALGVIGGALGQTIMLLPGLAALRRRPWPVWNPLDHHLREVACLLIPNGLSAVVNYACIVMDTAFASLAQEPVALVADYNAWLLVEMSITLFGQAVAQAVFPRLAAHGDASDPQYDYLAQMTLHEYLTVQKGFHPAVADFYTRFTVDALAGTSQQVNAYTAYENTLRADLSRVLAGTDFDFDCDVTAIYVYRWGHGMVMPTLGFPFGTPTVQGRQITRTLAPRHHARRLLGCIAFAGQDVESSPSMESAMASGWRTCREVLTQL